MGKTNDALNHFLKDDQEFADLINLSIYHGEHVVDAADLSEAGEVVYTKDTKKTLHERHNDVSKICRDGNTYQILCLENESKVSYIMPVRVLEYEAGRYMEQIRKITTEHQREDYADWSEYSSGFTREDRLYPVITLVLYWSREPWDGARSIWEMLDLSEEKKAALLPYIQEYKLNMINMYELQGTDACKGQLKYVLRLLQLDNDKKEIYKEIRTNEEYERLKPETGKVISALLGNSKISQYVDEQIAKKGEHVDMCKALEELCADMENRGLEQGRLQGIRIFILDNLEENVPGDRIILKLQRHYEVDEETAREYYQMYAKEAQA